MCRSRSRSDTSYFTARASSDAKEKTRVTPSAKNTSSPETPSSTPTATDSTASTESTSSTATPSPDSSSTSSPAPQSSSESSEKALRAALASLYPLKDVPLALSVGYLDAQGKGTVLAASMEVDTDALDFGDIAEYPRFAWADVWGVAIDDRGGFATFKQVLKLEHGPIHRFLRRYVQWSQQLPLPPGLYQVRIAVRDRRTGHIGTASQWVEIPEPASLALSSIFLAEPNLEKDPALVSVRRRFRRDWRLRFQTFIYNTQGAAASDLTLRVEVLRDGVSVMTLPEANASRGASTDPSRLPFSGEFSLSNLSPGRYVLQISAAAAQSKLAARQQANFIVEENR